MLVWLVKGLGRIVKHLSTLILIDLTYTIGIPRNMFIYFKYIDFL